MKAGWLILPGLLTMIALAINEVGIVSTYLAWCPGMLLEKRISLGLFALSHFDLADLLYLLAIGSVMFFRFARVNRQQSPHRS